jgi:hypothetical protein
MICDASRALTSYIEKTSRTEQNSCHFSIMHSAIRRDEMKVCLFCASIKNSLQHYGDKAVTGKERTDSSL